MDVLILSQVFFSVMFGAMQLGQAGPNFADIATAQGAAYQVFLVIDRVINLITWVFYCPANFGFSQYTTPTFSDDILTIF